MEIRKATDADIPAIVDLLKESLGQSILPKTESIWRYKHLENPFGKSIVLLGIEEEKVIGVRAFMKWEWKRGDENFLSLRAVDTATHPEHQGKGVFKKLTLAAINVAKLEGYHLIFNTPNTQSLPGYLKMGWVKVDKIKVNISPVNPFYWKFDSNKFLYTKMLSSSQDQFSELIAGYNFQMTKEDKLFTVKSLEYLNWRYMDNPLQSYEVYQDNNCYIACYVKEHKRFNELRCSEFILKDPNNYKSVMRIISQIAKKFGVQIISTHELLNKSRYFDVKGPYGPILTLKNLNLSNKEDLVLNELANWNYTLGDLELF